MSRQRKAQNTDKCFLELFKKWVCEVSASYAYTPIPVVTWILATRTRVVKLVIKTWPSFEWPVIIACICWDFNQDGCWSHCCDTTLKTLPLERWTHATFIELITMKYNISACEIFMLPVYALLNKGRGVLQWAGGDFQNPSKWLAKNARDK